MARITQVVRSFVAVHDPKVTQSAAVTVYGYNLVRLTDITKVSKLEKPLQAVTGQPVVITLGDNGCHFTVTVPNHQTHVVPFRETLTPSTYSIPCHIGKDTNNNPVTVDLSAQPHMLIAGATGSGKSVLLHDIISGIILTRTPSQVAFIMIDCKRTELTKYNQSRHLLTPVVTDPTEAVKTLETVCRVMDNRYRHLEQNPRAGFTSLVVVIDELADLMLQAGKQAEQALIRIAQLGRACKIHLIVATQRPSRQVIPGLLSANIPCKVALKVSTVTDSILILGHKGAEKLTGKGDCIIKTVTGTETRTQAGYITEAEIEYITNRA